MANYSSLYATIALNIYENHLNEVTANKVKAACDSMVASLGYGYQFRGAASPSDNPGVVDQRIYFLASTPGVYSNFGGITIAANEVALLKWDTEWHKETLDIPSKTQIMARLAAQDTQIAVQNGRLDGQDQEIADFKEAVQTQVDNYPMITINGNVTNAPDEEDITTDANNLLKFANRSALNGMGYVILRRDKTFAEQVTLANTIYEIRYDFTLDEDFSLPQAVVLKFNGGKIMGAGHNLFMSSNSGIYGKDGVLVNTRLVASGTENSPVKKVFVKDVTFDAEKNKHLENVVFGEYAEDVIFENIIVKDYYHNYNPPQEHSQYSVIYLSHFTNLSISHLQAKNGVCPNGLMIVWSYNVTISNFVIDDTNNESGIDYPESTGDIWSCLELFYNTNVVVENSFFRKRTSAGSLINCGCKNIVFRDCFMYGGNSVDVGDEWSQDESFYPGNILIDGCTLVDVTDGVKSLVNPNGEDGLTVSNCVIILNDTEQAHKSIFNLQNVKNFSAFNNKTQGGKEFLFLVGYTTGRDLGQYLIKGNTSDATYVVWVSDAVTTGLNIIIANNSIKASSVLIIDNRVNQNIIFHIIKNEFHATGGTLMINNSNDATSNAYKSNWIGNYFYSYNNSIDSSYRAILLAVNTKDTIIENNVFDGCSIRINNTTANKVIKTNVFKRGGNILILDAADKLIVEHNDWGNEYMRDAPNSAIGDNVVVRYNIGLYSFFNGNKIDENNRNKESLQPVFGTTANRPTTKRGTGFSYFDTNLGKPTYWSGSKYIESDGAAAGVKRSGTFSQKPSSSDIYVGFSYFCSDKQTSEGATNGIMIYHKGSDVWVDALGRTIS